MDVKSSLQGAKRRGNPENNKKVLILAFFTRLLRQLLCNFLRNDDLVTTQQFQNMGRVTGFEPATLRTTT